MKSRLIELYKQCFPEDSEKVIEYMFQTYLGEENALVEFDQDIIACALYLVDKTLYYKQSIIPLPYIVALGTATTHRYKGYSGKLVLKCLKKLYKENTPFVALYPFKHSFYQKYGFFIPSFDYVLTGEKVKCSMERVSALYDNFCNGLDYYIKRDDKYYSFIKGMLAIEDGNFYEIIKGNTVIGYTNGEETVPTSYKLGETNGAMVRIVDAISALRLSKLTFDKKIKIKDDLIKENNFSCIVTGGIVTKTSDYDIEVDIAILGEIIFGKKTLDGKNNNLLNGYLADKY
jgi:predicted acetyltransferase